MGKQLLAVAAIIVVLFSSCEEDINSSYTLTDSTKSFLSYEKGKTWTYDVSVNKDIYLETRHLIVDTIVEESRDVWVGQRFDYYKTEVTSTNSFPTVRFDSTMQIKDSIFLFGRYRVFQMDTAVYDSVMMKRTNLYRYGVTGDTMIFRAGYSLYDTIFHEDQLKYKNAPYQDSLDMISTDVLTVEEINSGVFENEMRNIFTTEEYKKSLISSTLNPGEDFVDIVLATSSGFEYYKRQIQRRQEYITAFEIGFNNSVIDTTRFDEALGIYSLEENGDFTVVKTKYDAENAQGGLITNDVEYWISKNGGVSKIINSTDETSWTLK